MSEMDALKSSRVWHGEQGQSVDPGPESFLGRAHVRLWRYRSRGRTFIRQILPRGWELTASWAGGGLAVSQGKLLTAGPGEGSDGPAPLAAEGEVQALLLVSRPLLLNTKPHGRHLSVLEGT